MWTVLIHIYNSLLPFPSPQRHWLLKKLCSKTENVVARLAHDRNTGKGKTPTQLSWATVALRREMQNIFGANYLVLHLAFYLLLELQPFIWLVISWMQPEQSEKRSLSARCLYADSLNAGFHQPLENEVQRPHVLLLWQAIQNWRKALSVLMKIVSKD